MAETLPARPELPLPIAISDCLLGNEVRYDGGSARSSFPHTLLDGLFEYRGICPEVGIGMSTPRDPIRLVGSVERPRVVGVKDPQLDVTDALTAFGATTAADLDDVVGYVFMKNSPSCGLFRVKVYPPDSGGVPERRGRGAHAAAIVERLPNLPVEENGRLNDPVLRENFVTRAFSYGHWQACFKEPGQLTAGRLIVFHSRYKYLLMAHSIPHYQQAGRLLSDLRDGLPEKAARYITVLMSGLAIPATAGGHANVLSHLQGYFKKQLDSSSRQELDRLISSYGRGEQPLLAPLTLLKHHLSRYPDEYLAHQVYLDPHPGYAGLRRLL
ncbi:MAG: DUF523 and DUF1722 domain-containing protein [Gammaproteobacteria bacterium]|nr:DUF523 and DUF1722 domain-containing protein [Gammaproteobacteria bacterium]